MARLSGSVSEIWSSPVSSSRSSIAWQRAAGTDRGDLLGQALPPRACGRRLCPVALVEALQIVVELGVGPLDERGQRGPREVAVLVVDRLEPRAVDRQQLAPEQVEFPAQQHQRAKDLPEGMTVVAAEVGNGLEVGLEVA